MSKQRNWKTCLLALGVLGMTCISVSPTPAQEGIGERIGARIDRFTEDLREGWDSLRKRIDQMGVQGRVYGRLRWDKHLDSTQLDIDVQQDNTVILRGQVASPAAKKKAVELANDTVGVTRVVDELVVVTPRE